ncbi:MAG TPA: DedA family protein [Anaerolineaceae bacterium]|nr:DedA family protein [Anaerolineaceae bacterium]HQH86499.1 DedA family protein [Anaerolineaceae bacterium]
MIDQIEIWILGLLQTLYDAWGWLGVAALLVFENATGITPSEVILGFAGWMLIAEHELPVSMIFLGGLYSAIGSVIGASITYWVARLGGRPVIDRFAHWVRIAPEHIIRAEQLFQRWGTGLVLIGRMIPAIRTLISIPAGLARMPFGIFVTTTFIGAYAWCTLLIGAGYLLGHEWELISLYLKQALPYLLVGGAIALGIYYWWMRRRAARTLLLAPGEDE